MSQEVFKVQGASKRFGGLQALSDVSLSIHEGQVYGLIGPNGAGKTTFFNVITGLYTPDSGSCELAGKPYEPSAVHAVAKANQFAHTEMREFNEPGNPCGFTMTGPEGQVYRFINETAPVSAMPADRNRPIQLTHAS